MSGNGTHFTGDDEMDDVDRPKAIQMTTMSSVEKCALFAKGTDGPLIACHKSISPDAAEIASTLVCARHPDASPWIGVRLYIPLGTDQTENEALGRGVRHVAAPDTTKIGDPVKVSDFEEIDIRLYRGQFLCNVEKAPNDVVSRFSGLKPKVVESGISILTIRVMDNEQAEIVGLGWPCVNPSEPRIDDWVKKNMPVVADMTLLKLFQAREFHMVIGQTPDMVVKKLIHDDLMPADFTYPYGNEHKWNPDLYAEQLVKCRGPKQFLAAFSYRNDNDHLAVVSQSVVQDFFWLEKEIMNLREDKTPIYFVPRNMDVAPEECRSFYVVMPRENAFSQRYSNAWPRLTKNLSLQLMLYSQKHDSLTGGIWNCKLVQHPNSIDELRRLHPTTDDDLVFEAWRPDLEDRSNGPEYDVKTPDAERKVNAVMDFHPEAGPTNAISLGLEENVKLADVPASIRDQMELHRAVLRGRGFYNWMAKSAPGHDFADNSGAISLNPLREVTRLRQIPVVNFLAIKDEQYVEVLLSQALPQDRARFRGYMSERPLGIGIMTAGPGFGKTTAIAVATLAMQASLGKILCSAPSNIAVDNFAERMDEISISVAAHYNKGKNTDDPTRSRHQLVIRAFKLETEVRAFVRLLKDPNEGDLAAPAQTKWRLHLSLTFWVLSLFGNGSFALGTRAIDPDDSEALAQIKAEYTDLPEYKNLFALLGGHITFEEYRDGGIVKAEKIAALMVSVLNRADMLCTTPSATERCAEFKVWKNGVAKGVAIDEAANMHRADMYCVWGNTLTPIFLAGDPRQLPPAVISSSTKDTEGNPLHRLANDGKISALAYIQASGCPVYRLKCQLRMGKGLFDIVSKEIYPDVPSTYSDNCNVDLAKFASGHLLEAFVRNKYPDIRPPPAGNFSPVFLHCPGSRVWIDGRTGSKKCKLQVQVAVEFAYELVTTAGVQAKDIAMITPYTANVEQIGRARKQTKFKAALLEMDEASTVDGYQGRENDIMIVVMGTSATSGPGFTSDENRLNVLFTRQRTGLVIVGDIDAAGILDEERRNKRRKIETIAITDIMGNISRTKALVLRSVYRQLRDSGRVVEAKAAGAEEE
ncbi:hypothetical protein ACHAQA_007093 [Verticillium albo-atrum]